MFALSTDYFLYFGLISPEKLETLRKNCGKNVTTYDCEKELGCLHPKGKLLRVESISI